MIKIICVGKIKDKYLEEGIKNYLTKIKHYCKLEIIELNNGNFNEKEYLKNILKEEEEILKKINADDYVIGLFIEGNLITSETLARKINELEIHSKDIIFLIGGSYGMGENIKKRCNEIISFSKMTLTHQMIRLFLLEQIFRSYKILKNESYHK